MPRNVCIFRCIKKIPFINRIYTIHADLRLSYYSSFQIVEMSSNMQNTPPQREKQTLSDFHSAEESESKFWRKVKKDPVVPLGKHTS